MEKRKEHQHFFRPPPCTPDILSRVDVLDLVQHRWAKCEPQQSQPCSCQLAMETVCWGYLHNISKQLHCVNLGDGSVLLLHKAALTLVTATFCSATS